MSRDTLSFVIGMSSEPMSLTDPRIVFDAITSGELCLPAESCCPGRLVVELDPDVLIPELAELSLPFNRSDHVFDGI